MSDVFRAPEFTVWCGPMWSGKSSALLAAIDRYRHQGRHITVFKPGIDDRYADDKVVTHSGWHVPAHSVRTGFELLRELVDSDDVLDIIAVDELFMIPGGADALLELFSDGVTVLVSSLDLSAKGKVFHEVEAVLPWATRVEKLTAVCAVCKADARYTWKKSAGTDEIEVGGAEAYEPRCWMHHPIINARQEKKESMS